MEQEEEEEEAEEAAAAAERRKKQKHDDMNEPKPDTTPEGETETEAGKSDTRRHFVLVHGPCHGGWVWYKLVTLLSSAGHRVSAIDLAGCGVDPARIEDLHTFDEHVAPLMAVLASIPEGEKVVAVGHCFGGYALSLAMERFPKRIAAAVFATGLMPKQWTSPASTLDEFLQRDHIESLMDCQLSFDPGRENPLASYTYGPEFMATIMYNCCPPEDATLAALLARPAGLYLEDISNETMLSGENYGSVARVYIISKQDKLYTEDYQRWIIENNPPKEVKEIEGSDHMLMLSKTQELCNCLLEIAEKYV
eukprot:TRINITY_DN582_c3_g1_i1.p1 TRINITY_DN582_c3_g1~~TRINITY_DN582_c3_g1_i1.p1  ORF type:complete len:308 (-),score=32.59 TRINITY_DN582_c3_g1_i1:328-1251(-)